MATAIGHRVIAMTARRFWGAVDKICDLYGNAARAVPGNEELLSHLFMAHVRVNNYSAQQTVALQLYKLNPKNPYYFWAVMSIVLKALYGADSGDPIKTRVLLALAQRLVDKHIADDRLDAEQEVQLYLNVLTLQGKHAEALAFMESDVGVRLYPGAPVAMRIEAMKKLGRWSDVEVLVRGLLRDKYASNSVLCVWVCSNTNRAIYACRSRERWDYYKEFVQCAVELHKNAEGTLADVDIETLRPYKEFIAEVWLDSSATHIGFVSNISFVPNSQLIDADDSRIRGPFLGRLLLHKTLQQQRFAAVDQLLGAGMLDLLVEYFQLFGQKPCCTNDIQMFLECLSADERVGFAERLRGACQVSSLAVPQSRDQMQQHICTLQISRICGAHELNAEHLTALYTAFSLHYEHGMTAFGGDLLPTDMGPSDAYALLAGELGLDALPLA